MNAIVSRRFYFFNSHHSILAVCAWLVESFPASIRLTSVAVGYNIAQACVGGSTPAIATYLVDTVGNYAPGIMVSVIAALSLSGLYFAPGEGNEVTKSTREIDEIFSNYSDDEDELSRGISLGDTGDIQLKEIQVNTGGIV